MTESTPSVQMLPEGFIALIKLEGREADYHQARAEQLAVVLLGMQKVAYLLAAADMEQNVGVRVKPSRVMRERYAIRCGVPQEGSYALPMAEGIDNDILDCACPSLFLDRMQSIFSAVSRQDEQALQSLLPSGLIERALREILKFLPKEQEGVSLSLATRTSPQPAVLSQKATRFIKEKLSPATPEDTTTTVTGELQSIDFTARQLTIIYPPTRREIVCTYLPEVEDTILESRKEPIQVTGQFVLDSEGNPIKLMDVTRVEPVDLSSLVFTQLEALDVKFRHPLELVPILYEESQQYLTVSYQDLNLYAFGLNREILFDEVELQLSMLWQEYACADIATLDQEAQQLRVRLLSFMEEGNNATA